MFPVLVALAAILSNSSGARSAGPIVCKGTSCKSYAASSKRVWRPTPDRTDSSVSCSKAYVVDGDTLRCGHNRIRLLGIDAPEVERCPSWRECAPGDAQASKRSLLAVVRSGPISYQPVTHDRYGRTVAVVWAGGANLSCWQLRHQQAIYKPNWGTGQFIARECR